jgi:hypothetical protein
MQGESLLITARAEEWWCIVYSELRDVFAQRRVLGRQNTDVPAN